MASDVEELENEALEPPLTLSQRLGQAFLGFRTPREPPLPEPTLDNPLDDQGRREYIKSLSTVERKWVNGALYLGLFGGIIISWYVAVAHSTRKETTRLIGGLPWGNGSKTVTVPLTKSWIILGLTVAVLAIIGLVGVHYSKRSLVTFSLLILGLSYSLLFTPLGLGLMVVGGWLLLHAYRVQKHGVPSGKAAATASAQRRAERRSGTTTPRSSSRKPAPRAAVTTGAKGPPTASKRYTPKAAPKKKIAKPT